MAKPKPNRRRAQPPRPPQPEAPAPSPGGDAGQPHDGPPWRIEIADDRGKVHIYVCEPFYADHGLELQGRLGWALGALVGVGGEMVAGDGRAIPGQAISEAVSSACGRLLVEEGVGLFIDLLSRTTRDGRPINSLEAFRDVYTLNYGELYAATGWVVKRNFERWLRRLPFALILGEALDGEAFKLGWQAFISGSLPTSSSGSPSSTSPKDSASTPS